MPNATKHKDFATFLLLSNFICYLCSHFVSMAEGPNSIDLCHRIACHTSYLSKNDPKMLEGTLENVGRQDIKGCEAVCKVKSASVIVKSMALINKSKALIDKSKAMI